MTAVGQPSALEVPAGDEALSVGTHLPFPGVGLEHSQEPSHSPGNSVRTQRRASSRCVLGRTGWRAGGAVCRGWRQLRQTQLLSNVQLSPTLTGSSAGQEPTFNAGDQVQPLGREGPLEKGMATHSSILAWRIPWT